MIHVRGESVARLCVFPTPITGDQVAELVASHFYVRTFRELPQNLGCDCFLVERSGRLLENRTGDRKQLSLLHAGCLLCAHDSMEDAWKKFRYRLEWLAASLLAWAIPLLPRRACAVLARALGSIAYALDSRGRPVSLANLEAAFSERYSAGERGKIARASYQS